MPGGRGRGGRRTGTPGTAYAQRSDLNAPLAPTAVPGQPYGAAGQQLSAQQVAPMAGAPVGGQPPSAPAGAPPQQGPPPIPPGMPKPGEMGSLFAPSTNPDEDVMSGATKGPGPGPEAFPFGQQSQNNTAWTQKYLPAMEFAANARSGDDPSKQVIRLLKAGLDLGSM